MDYYLTYVENSYYDGWLELKSQVREQNHGLEERVARI